MAGDEVGRHDGRGFSIVAKRGGGMVAKLGSGVERNEVRMEWIGCMAGVGSYTKRIESA